MKPSTVAAPGLALPLSRPSAAIGAQGSVSTDNDGAELSTTDETGTSSSLLESRSPNATDGANPLPSRAAGPLSLAAKLAAVAAGIDRVAKKGRNDDQKYDYVTAADILDEVRGELAKQRVALRWSINQEQTKFDEATSRGGAKGLFCTLWLTYTFVDGDDGTSFDYHTVGTATDYPGDKAVYKAQTNALKYLLTQTFLISTGDDVEADGSDEKSPADVAATKHLTAEQQAELERLNKLCIAPVPPGLPWNSLTAGRSFEQIKVHLEARREQQAKPVKA